MKEYIFVLLMLCFSMHAQTFRVKNSRWIDPYGRQPITHKAWYNSHGAGKEAAVIGKVYEKNIGNRQNHVDVVVNSCVYSQLENEITTFTQDLVAAGYSCQVDTISGMSHSSLRSHLAAIPGLVGAIFVGEVPLAWFETNGFGSWEEFPHDLYFCDLDGLYADADGDGIYDNHTGNVAPEIWVGRINARTLTWDNEVNLLKNYFWKNHLYRVDSLPLLQRGLSYVDDDWSYWTTCDLDLVYDDVTVVNDNYQTTATTYRNQLNQEYEWIHLCAHSSPWGHTFKYPPDEYRGTVFNYEIFVFEPKALFYNLFACSGTRFVEDNYSAGWYLFNDNYGLLAVGSAKTGGMLEFADFYGPIGQQNMSIGDGFKHWFTLWAESSWDWFYGMNILGDPTLKPKNQASSRSNLYHGTTLRGRSDWEEPIVVAPDPESDGFPHIMANADGRVWMVWESGRSQSNGRSEIYSAYYDAGVWSNALNVGPFIYWDYGPAIGTDNNNRPITVWAGWFDQEGNYQYDLFYSVYDGLWSERQSVHTLDPGFDVNPALVKDTLGRLWVSWESRRNVNLDIYTTLYSGSAWYAPEQVTSDNADEKNPFMLVDTLGRLWIFYCRRYAERSEIWGSFHDGVQWIESGPISSTQKMACHPAAAVHGNGKICVVWQTGEFGNCDIYGSFYDGANWSMPYQITANPEADLFPTLTVDRGGAVWLAYQAELSGDWEICTACCIDSAWDAPEIASGAVGADINPTVACSPENELWLSWQSYAPGNWEIMASHHPGTGIIEGDLNFKKPILAVMPTVFSTRLQIMTARPNQEVRIYDSRGARVQTLISADNGKATWSPKNIASGVYFVVVEENSSIVSKKVLLCK